MAKQISQPAKQPAPETASIQTEKSNKGFSLKTKLALLLGIIAFLLYANTLKNDYVLDDFTVIKSNSIVTRGISAIPEILATPYRRGWFITTNDLYRPLSLVMFAAEWQLGDGKPGPGHLMNVLFFAGCVILLFLFIDGLFGGRKSAAAFITAFIFALHPIHTEVVANIKSRDEILCFFFAFLSLNIYLKYMQTGKMQQLLLASFCFLLSFLSKETVISFLFVIPFIFFLYRNENKTRSLYITLSSVAVTVLFLVIRYSVLHKYDANTTSEVSFMDNFLTISPSALSRFATEILILGKYIKLMFVPYPLISDYSYNSIPFTDFGNVWVLLSLAGYAFLVVFSVMRVIKNNKDPFAFGILFFLSTIALFSNIVFIIGAPMAERFAFFASVGFCLVIALLIEKFLLGEGAVVADIFKNT
ncbi:MAG: glycosyltransferase family 39 protein, partial [Taibaiella sp.]|nr:glycosyltransferase family 39 protein [Taibaiella sp.]